MGQVFDAIAGMGVSILHFVIAVLFFCLFAWVYIRITPYDELSLIREGNHAAAISYSGALLGYALALAGAVSFAGDNYILMVVFTFTATVIQILAYQLVRIFLFHRLSERIENGETATALVLAAVAVAFGLVNSASFAWWEPPYIGLDDEEVVGVVYEEPEQQVYL